MPVVSIGKNKDRVVHDEDKENVSGRYARDTRKCCRMHTRKRSVKMILYTSCFLGVAPANLVDQRRSEPYQFSWDKDAGSLLQMTKRQRNSNQLLKIETVISENDIQFV
jgi:hypothetical protein